MLDVGEERNKMSKSVLISIRPKWCGLIAKGEKTVEVRKNKPKLEMPFKCYIYCTKDSKLQFWTGKRYSYADDHSHNIFDKCGNGKVIGEFVCDRIIVADPGNYVTLGVLDTMLDALDLMDYANEKTVYGWHISDLVIYDKPKGLDWFRKPIDCHRGKDRENCRGCWDCEIKRAPQSWCYVDESS